MVSDKGGSKRVEEKDGDQQKLQRFMEAITRYIWSVIYNMFTVPKCRAVHKYDTIINGFALY